MMAPEYFTVVGYFGDGFIVCVNCGEEHKMPVSDQITEAQAEAEADFSGTGLYCDDCGREIVESDYETIDEEIDWSEDED
jgi:hypothetical protein